LSALFLIIASISSGRTDFLNFPFDEEGENDLFLGEEEIWRLPKLFGEA